MFALGFGQWNGKSLQMSDFVDADIGYKDFFHRAFI
jgi:hypothetical protein